MLPKLKANAHESSRYVRVFFPQNGLARHSTEIKCGKDVSTASTRDFMFVAAALLRTHCNLSYKIQYRCMSEDAYNRKRTDTCVAAKRWVRFKRLTARTFVVRRVDGRAASPANTNDPCLLPCIDVLVICMF